MGRRGGWQVHLRKVAKLKAEYLANALSSSSKLYPEFIKWAEEIEDFAKQTAGSQTDSGITEEQALCVIKSFISLTENATRLGNVPIFIKDSIAILEKAEQKKQLKATKNNEPMKDCCQTPNLNAINATPNLSPMERLEAPKQTQTSTQWFAEQRSTEPLKVLEPTKTPTQFFAEQRSTEPLKVLEQTQKSTERFAEQRSTESLKPPEQTQTSTEWFVEKRSTKPLKAYHPYWHKSKFDAPRSLQLSDVFGQAQKSAESRSTQRFKATRQNRASVIVTASAMYESPPLTNPPFVPLIPKVEST